MSIVIVKFYREDRDPLGKDHNYGEDIDVLINKMIGGENKVDRSLHNPIAAIPNTQIAIGLHEDGPIIQFVIEQIPNFLSAFSALASAWIAWKVMKKEEKNEYSDYIPGERKIEIKVGNHIYKGRPKNSDDLKLIIDFLAKLYRDENKNQSEQN